MNSRPYVSLLRALGDAGVEIALAGGFVVVLHGVPRMTFALDIVVNLTPANMSKLVGVLRGEGFRPRLPVALSDLEDAEKRREWTETRNLIAFSLNHPQRPMEELDVLLVIGRALLCRMKRATGRERDAMDAELLGAGDA